MSAGPTTVPGGAADPAAPATGAADPASGPAAGRQDPGGAGAGSGGPSTATRIRQRWQRWRWTLGVSALVVVCAVLAVLLTPTTDARDLDPDSAAPAGSRAVAQILARQGVTVERVTNSLLLASADADTTLVVVHPELLGPVQLDRIEATKANLVLVEPDLVALQALDPEVRVAGVAAPGTVAPGCGEPAATAAGAARAGGHLYEPAIPGPAVCYPADGQGLRGSMVDSYLTRPTTVLGQADVLRNRYLNQDGNAALALWTLGRSPRLIWYLPDPLELGQTGQGGQPSLTSLMAPWVRWVTLQLLVVALVAMLWRARRLGGVVREPLPIVVRAAETQEGRARLYRQVGARGRAAATLRTATARRLAARLSIPVDATPEQVTELVAGATGQSPAAVHEILLGGAPGSDGALVRLADDLDRLERALGPRQVFGAATGGAGQDAGTPAPPGSGNPGSGGPGTGSTGTGSAGSGLPTWTSTESGTTESQREAPPQ